MIEQIKLCLDHKRFISNNKEFKFSKGVNVIIGPNGSGKTSLLNAIHKCSKCIRKENNKTEYRYYNGETMNPHKTYKYFKGIYGSVIRTRSMFSSHGETMRDVLGMFNLKKGDCFILDEPEIGHDLEWIINIRKGLDNIVKRGCQVIVASHHVVFWKNSNLVELKQNYCKTIYKIYSKQIK